MVVRRRWTEDDRARLKSLAGTKSVEAVAAELGRTAGAVVVQASKLKVSTAHKKQRRASFYKPHSAPSF
jgi:hypothetical protein